MNLKKTILKSTWKTTVIFIIFSMVTNFCMVSIARKIENIISQLEGLQSEGFMKIVLYSFLSNNFL